MDWKTIVVEPVKVMLIRAGAFVPTLVGVLIILIVGWIIANIVKSIITKVLKIAQLDTAGEKSGFSDLLRKGGIRYTISELIGVLGYWLVMLLVFISALNAFGMTVAAELLDKVLLYIPNVIASIFILVLGLFFAGLMGTIVRTAATNAGIGQARLLGQLVQVIIGIFAVAVALEQLKIGTTTIALALNILIASIGLAFAIAFGLGAKDAAGKIISDFIEKLKAK